jgi:hypothetical protein
MKKSTGREPLHSTSKHRFHLSVGLGGKKINKKMLTMKSKVLLVLAMVQCASCRISGTFNSQSLEELHSTEAPMKRLLAEKGEKKQADERYKQLILDGLGNSFCNSAQGESDIERHDDEVTHSLL